MWLVVLLAAAAPQAARAYSLLSYVAADYPTAVSASGEVTSPQELDEQNVFAGDAARELGTAGATDLAKEAELLRDRIADRAPPRDIVPLARTLADRIAQRFQLKMLPLRAPDPRRGRAVYRQACAACHGADGTPRTEHLELSTRPIAFASRDDVARLSPQRIFAAVLFGVPGTAMPSFEGAIDESAIWDVAFAALLFACPGEERARGESIVRKLPRRPDWLQLALRSDEQLRLALSGSPFPPADREALICAIRAKWSEPGPAAEETAAPAAGGTAAVGSR